MGLMYPTVKLFLAGGRIDTIHSAVSYCDHCEHHLGHGIYYVCCTAADMWTMFDNVRNEEYKTQRSAFSWWTAPSWVSVNMGPPSKMGPGLPMISTAHSVPECGFAGLKTYLHTSWTCPGDGSHYYWCIVHSGSHNSSQCDEMMSS